MRVLPCEFFSDGTSIAGVLTEPEDTSRRYPGVVLCHGFSAVKEMVSPDAAAAFASGPDPFVALAFDYRFFGASGGEPRGRLHPLEQVDDIRAALSFLETHPLVDVNRLCLWGPSFGGGNALHVRSVDDRVAATVIVNPVTDGNAWVRSRNSVASMVELLERVRQGRVAAATSPDVCEIPTAEFIPSTPGKSEKAPRPWEDLRRPASITLDSVDKILSHRPVTLASAASTPLLVVVSPRDTIVPCSEGENAFRAASGEKRLIRLPPECGHYNTYEPPWAETVFAHSAEWLNAVLRTTAS